MLGWMEGLATGWNEAYPYSFVSAKGKARPKAAENP
jgi:hypothetical protein